MPPRLPLRPIGRHNAFTKKHTLSLEKEPICLFCSLSRQSDKKSSRRLRANNKKAFDGRRLESTASPSTPRAPVDPRKELVEALVDLQKRAPNYVNISRVQLALKGLRQRSGDESIRVAILGVKNGTESCNTAKEVLKLLLADPLKPEEDWEKEIDGHDLSHPLVVRIGPEKRQESSFTRGEPQHEVNVSSAVLNGHNVELLLMDTNPLLDWRREETPEGLEDSVLLPAIDIPGPNTGGYMPITTPVHKALFVADSFKGAASLTSIPALKTSTVVSAAVDLPSYKPEETEASTLPFTLVDVGTANVGLRAIRKDLRSAIEFEHLWFQSNVPKLVEWLKSDTAATTGETTKPPVRALIASILASTKAAMDRGISNKPGHVSGISPASLPKLRANLEGWAESAHGELQEQLDLAFSSKRWRRLRWWKLFWRVDDVGMFTTDILNQRFLTEAEKSSIFLAGQMREAGISSCPVTPLKSEETALEDPTQPTEVGDAPRPRPITSLWPVNIAASRNYLQTETVPALQALAQKLVVETLTTSGLTSSLGALVYLSTLTTTVFEAGAIAALGTVWSMGRMQKKWETARSFWEGEVREEGRKAVRNVEREFGKSLTGCETGAKGTTAGKPGELSQARELVKRAREAYEKLK